jgi:TolB protein
VRTLRIIIGCIIFILIGGLVWAFHSNETRSSAGPRATYSSNTYNVSFSYPADWQPTAGFTTDRFEGESGFFEVSTAGTGTLLTVSDIVGNKAQNGVSPYGTAPSIKTIKIDGEEAELVLPSADADPALKGQAVLVVLYPEPVTVATTTYEYFVLFADQYHILGMANSLTFLVK